MKYLGKYFYLIKILSILGGTMKKYTSDLENSTVVYTCDEGTLMLGSPVAECRVVDVVESEARPGARPSTKIMKWVFVPQCVQETCLIKEGNVRNMFTNILLPGNW